MTTTTKTIEELEEMEARIKRALDVIESSDDEGAVRAGKAVHRDLTDLRGLQRQPGPVGWRTQFGLHASKRVDPEPQRHRDGPG